MEDAKKIWEAFGMSATWDRFDFIDQPYVWDCNVYLEITGYEFEGYGQETCGERELLELTCKLPNGEIVKLI